MNGFVDAGSYQSKLESLVHLTPLATTWRARFHSREAETRLLNSVRAYDIVARIHDVVVNPDSAELARAIISLAGSLRLRVVAEGIETEEQQGFLEAAATSARATFTASHARART